MCVYLAVANARVCDVHARGRIELTEAADGGLSQPMRSPCEALILRAECDTPDEDEQGQRRAAKRFVPWVALLLALVTACGLGGSRLVIPGSQGGSVTVQLPAKKHQSWVHGSYTMCLDEPGEVRVTSVEFKSGNLELAGWALRPNPGAEGKDLAGDTAGGTLTTRGIENTEVLTRVCDDQGNSYELVLQLRSGESSTEGDGIIVRYTSGGRERTLVLPDRVVMCVRPERPECA